MNTRTRNFTRSDHHLHAACCLLAASLACSGVDDPDVTIASTGGSGGQSGSGGETGSGGKTGSGGQDGTGGEAGGAGGDAGATGGTGGEAGTDGGAGADGTGGSAGGAVCSPECTDPTPDCENGACVVCKNDRLKCQGSISQKCEDHQWVNQAPCPTSTPICVDGQCTGTRLTGGIVTTAVTTGGAYRLRSGGLETRRSCTTTGTIVCATAGILP
jgi:hypothetical protein